MTHRASSKTYTQKALQTWSDRISTSWETFFTEHELQLGREFYKQGLIRQIDLHELGTVISTKIEKEERYSVIDWENGKPSVRGSTTDIFWHKALAIAGLYEIEELIAEEAPPTPYDISDENKAEDKQKTQDKPKELGTSRPLLLKFYVRPQGLCFEAYWVEHHRLIHALDAKQSTSKNKAEREKIILLSTFARKEQFQSIDKNKYYRLSNLEHIPTFLNEQLLVWEKYFKIEETPEVVALAKGPLAIKLKAQTHAKGGSTFSLDWQLFIEETALTLKEQRQLLGKQSAITLLPHVGLIQLSQQQKDILSDWKQWENTQEDKGTLPNYMLFSLFAKNIQKLQHTDTLLGWKQSLLNFSLKEPNKELTFLRPYQHEGVQWLHHLCQHDCHPLLADEMGLGKTLQVLSLINNYPIPDLPSLIVCPASVVSVWQNEAQRFFPNLKTQLLNKNNTFEDKTERSLWIASYTQLRRHKHLLNQTSFGYAALDEAQSIKNPDAKVSQAAMSICAEHRIALTGTPLENKYLDLWTLFRFLMPGLLGSRKTFLDKIAHHPGTGIQELHAQLKPFILRRTKDVVAKDLPQKTEINLECPLSPQQHEWYTKLTHEGLNALESIANQHSRKNAFHLFTLLTRLRQVCCDPYIIPGIPTEDTISGKTHLLIEKLKSILASNHKVVLFSQFTRYLSRIKNTVKENFEQTPLFELTGKTRDRNEVISSFQNTSGAAIILVSLRAGGTGITLHAADYVFLLDPWWNPAVEAQAIDRVHRIGQTKPVFVYRMIAKDTIEERIQSLKDHKSELFQDLIDTLAHPSAISKHYDAIKALIQLSP